MDLSIAVNAPREVVIGGLPYQVSGLTRAEWGGLQAWLKDHAGDPVSRAYAELAEVRKKGVDIDDRDRDAVLKEARERMLVWPPMVASEAWFALLNQTEGGPHQFFAVVLRKHQPSLTDEQVADLITKVDKDTSEVIVWRAIGMDPPPKDASPTGRPNRKTRRASNAKTWAKSTTS